MVSGIAPLARLQAFGTVGFLLSTLALSGCVEKVADVRPDASARLAAQKRAGLTPRGASVSLADLQGAPDSVATRFKSSFQSEAAGRDIVTAETKDANYLVRGYLTAYPAPGGTALAYVYDVFDREKHRAQRVNDEIIVPGSSSDPWSLVDDKALASIASRSADGLAIFLAATPEAMAAANSPAGLAASAAGVTNLPVLNESEPVKLPAGALGYAAMR